MGFFGSLLKIVAAGLFFASTIVSGGASFALFGAGIVTSFIATQIDRRPRLQDRQLNLQTRRDAGAAIPVVYGKAKIGTIAVDMLVDTDSADDSTLYMPLVLAHGSRRYSATEQMGIAEVLEVYLDGTLALSDVLPDTYWSTTYSFNPESPFSDSSVGFVVLEGTHDQNAGATVIGGLGAHTPKALSDVVGSSWSDTTDKGAGLALLLLRLRNRTQDEKPVFPRGAPQATAVVFGNFVEDPRDFVAAGPSISFTAATKTIARASGAWSAGYEPGDKIIVAGSTSNDGVYTLLTVTSSELKTIEPLTDEAGSTTETIARWAHPGNGGDNPALCIRDYLLSDTYGPGYAPGLLDEASFLEAADECDDIVAVPGGNQKRFTCNGVVDTTREVGEVLNDLLSSCRGNLVWEGGKFKLYIRRAQAPVAMPLNESNIIGQWSFSNAGLETRWNLVRVRYVSEEKDWELAETQWPRVSVANTYLAADNDFLNELALDLPFTFDQHMAQQIAQVLLNESRQGIKASVTATEEALQLSVGDVVDVTHSTPQWDDKPFWVEALQLLPDTSVRVHLREYDGAAYNLSTLDDRDTEPDTQLGNLFVAPPPTGVQLNDDGNQQDDRLRVSWTPPVYAFTDYIEVQARKTKQADGSTVLDEYRTIARVRQTDETFFAGVRDKETWQARARTVNTIGTLSVWAESAPKLVALHDVPEIDLSLSAAPNGVEITVDLDDDGDGIDAAYVDLYARVNSGASGADPFETAAYFVTRVVPPASPVLVIADDGEFVRAFGVPFNKWGERGALSAVEEAESGATGAGPSDPPSNIGSANVQVEQFDVTWTNGDVTAQTRVYVDGGLYGTAAAGVTSLTVTDRESNTQYSVAIRHLKGGEENPTDNSVSTQIGTATGTLGVPQALSVQTVQPYAVRLAWNAGTDGETASYVIERSATGAFGGEETQIGTTQPGVTLFDHSDPAIPGQSRYFRVKAQRANWNDSPFTAGALGTYGANPDVSNAGFSISYADCVGQGCGQLLGCPQTGNRHLISWNHSGANDNDHHVEIWREINGGAFAKVLDDLSVEEVHTCGSVTNRDGAFALIYTDCGQAGSGGDDYRYRVELRKNSDNSLISSSTTQVQTYRPATEGCLQ